MTNSITKPHGAKKSFVPGTSRGPRSARTLLLQMAMEEERQKEIGARIKELREGRRLTQPVVADRVGVTLRAYQAWEAGGGIAWQNLGRLAEVLGVDEDHVLYGPPEERVVAGGSQLDRIEAKLDELLSRLPASAGPAEVLEAEAARVRAQRKRTDAKSKSTPRTASGA